MTKQPLWTIGEALQLVRLMQPLSRAYGYHLAMGGGVLNNGESTKDLDFYFLPLDNEGATDIAGLQKWLTTILGSGEDINDPKYGPSENYAAKWKFNNNGKRVDVFVAMSGS